MLTVSNKYEKQVQNIHMVNKKIYISHTENLQATFQKF